MSSASPTNSTIRLSPQLRLSSWRARVVQGLLLVLSGLAALLLWRMCRGALRQPLPLAGLIVFACILPVVTAIIRVWYPRREAIAPVPATESFTGYLEYLHEYLFPSILSCIIAAALTIRNSSALGVTLLWITVGIDTLGVLCWPRLRWFMNRNKTSNPSLHENQIQTTPEMALTNTPKLIFRIQDSDEIAETDAESESAWLFTEPKGLLEMRRWQTDSGSQLLSGACRHEVKAGQRIAVTHTVLHPIWPKQPQVNIEQFEPDEIEIRAVQILPQGIRWEIRLPEAAPESFVVTWSYVIE